MKIGWYPIKKYGSIVQSLAQSTGLENCCVNSEQEADQYDIIMSFGNKPVSQKDHQTWYHIDGAYFGRPKFFRITKNAFQPHRYIMDIERPGNRWLHFKKKIQPWKKDGENILICQVSDRNCEFLGFDRQQDGKMLQEIISKQTDLPIVVREKAEKFKHSFSHALNEAKAIVTWASTVSVDAIIEGVPIFIMTESCCSPMSGDIHNITQPYYPENREQWLNNLAYCQWNTSEIKDGTAWHYLNQIGQKHSKNSAAKLAQTK